MFDVGPFVREGNVFVLYECCISQLYMFKWLMWVHLYEKVMLACYFNVASYNWLILVHL